MKELEDMRYCKSDPQLEGTKLEMQKMKMKIRHGTDIMCECDKCQIAKKKKAFIFATKGQL